MKKIIRLTVLFFLLSFFSIIASAQCWRVIYCEGCVKSGLCDEYRDFNTEREAIASLRSACATGGSYQYLNDCSSQPDLHKPGFSKSPVRNGIGGALLFGLVGSAIKDNNGKLLWDLGVTGGFALFSIITTIAVPKSRSFGEGFLLGFINGGTLFYAADRVKIIVNDKPAAPKPPDEVTKEALIAAGVGAVAGGLLGGFTARPAKSNSISRLIRKSKLLSHSALTFGGNKMGFVIRL
jgi:hypothetical protein